MQDIQKLYDVVVVGGGPAGLSAAIYAARAKYRVLVLEKESFGGQITITSEVVNYPGVKKLGGRELTEQMKEQAEAFGAEFMLAEVLTMELEPEIKILHTSKGDFRALGVILATGANPRKLGFLGEKEFQGRGVAYCATCDGEFFTGMDIYVIGGGFAAVEEGIFLTKYARKVTMIVRGDKFSCAASVAGEVEKNEKMDVKFHTEIMEVSGGGMVTHARFKNNLTGEEWETDAASDGPFGVFVFAGYVPNTAWISKAVERNEQGYLITDANHKTNLEGVYAAGDVCIKNLRQVVTAVSDGAVAATALEKYLGEIHHRLAIPDLEYQRPEKNTMDEKKSVQGSGSETAASGNMAGKGGAGNPAETGEAPEDTAGGGFISEAIRSQLAGVFAKFASRVVVKAWLDDTPLSGEMRGFLEELVTVTDKVIWQEADGKEEKEGRILPSMELYREDGSTSGIRFHGVPGGHEFNSFIIALYNVAGPGQEVDPQQAERLKGLGKDVNIKVLVSLSCTMCPETVMAAQKAAALSPGVEAEMFDLMHFPALKQKYQVMSVPCMVVNDEAVYFGKKGFADIVDILAGIS